MSSRYDRDVLIVETAYPFTLADGTPAWENIIRQPDQLVPGYPATPAGQAAQYRAVQDAVASAEGGRRIGTVYWEPTWTSVPGAGWDPEDPTSGNAWETRPSSTSPAPSSPPRATWPPTQPRSAAAEYWHRTGVTG